MPTNAEIVATGWNAVATGDWDLLVQDYVDDMIFSMPGQDDILEGKAAFREALDNLGAALPPGFEITSLRHISEHDEVVSIVEWKSEKVPAGSQCSVLFKLKDSKILTERWFIETEQWKAAF